MQYIIDIDIYKNNPNLSDKQISKIIEPINRDKREGVFRKVTKTLWILRGLPQLIKNSIAENPNLNVAQRAELLRQKDNNVLDWMIYDIIRNKPIKDDDGILPIKPTVPIKPVPGMMQVNPFRYSQQSQSNFSYGTGGGKRVIRSTRGLS